MTLYCHNAEKKGNLCYGYSEKEDSVCKNCIKCINGYYQKGEIPEELKIKNDNEVKEN